MTAAHYAKAIVAILGAGVTAALGIWTSGEVANVLTIVSALLTAAGVYLIPNTDPTAQHQGESVQPPEPGVHRPEVVNPGP